MTDNQDTKLNFVKVEATGFQSICDRLAELEKENEALTARNEFLERMCNGIKLNNSKLTQERNALLEEVTALKNMNGRDFAKSFFGVPMTPDEVAIEAAENNYVPYNGDDF